MLQSMGKMPESYCSYHFIVTRTNLENVVGIPTIGDGERSLLEPDIVLEL